MKSGLTAAAATASGSSATQRVSPRQATAEDAANAATADAAVTESRTIYKVRFIGLGLLYSSARSILENCKFVIDFLQIKIINSWLKIKLKMDYFACKWLKRVDS